MQTTFGKLASIYVRAIGLRHMREWAADQRVHCSTVRFASETRHWPLGSTSVAASASRPTRAPRVVLACTGATTCTLESGTSTRAA